MKFLEEQKTYIVAFGVVVAAVVAWLVGEVDLITAITMALTGLGLGTLRAGSKTDAAKIIEEVPAEIAGTAADRKDAHL